MTQANTQPSTSRRFDDLPYAQQAGMLCNDDRFQRYAAIRCGLPKTQFRPSAAARYLRDVCGITSRRQLNSEAAAQQKFQALRTDFDAWRGRIARPRK